MLRVQFIQSLPFHHLWFCSFQVKSRLLFRPHSAHTFHAFFGLGLFLVENRCSHLACEFLSPSFLLCGYSAGAFSLSTVLHYLQFSSVLLLIFVLFFFAGLAFDFSINCLQEGHECHTPSANTSRSRLTVIEKEKNNFLKGNFLFSFDLRHVTRAASCRLISLPLRLDSFESELYIFLLL